MSRLTLIVAATKSNAIGRNGRLPWRLPKEMKYFADVTSNAPEGETNAVIMGRNTWESIPKKFRPLPNRVNIVISRNQNYDLGDVGNAQAHMITDLSSAIVRLDALTSENRQMHRKFIIGGASIYTESLAFPSSSLIAFVDRVLLTRIISPAFEDCDEDLNAWVGLEVPEGPQTENGVDYEFQMWTRDAN
ncbi:dihydrofolate reductase [Infundibulicybe gibba]|nr:dihydrofolate reductase [Infundibulicybe gibba]